MFFRKRLIHIDLLPNFEKDDFELIRKLGRGWNFKSESYEEKIKEFLSQMFPRSDFYFFSSGRTALSSILLFLKDKFSQKEVYTQAFSCLVVPNAIKFVGLNPVFIDIEKGTFHMDMNDLENKISRDGLALIVQNTFGLPDDLDRILKIVKERNLFLIENLAHAFGAKWRGKFLGNFGDFAIVSFDNTKVISSLGGGLLIINRDEFKEEFKNWYERLPVMNNNEVIRRIKFALLLERFKKFYHPIGKYVLGILKNLNLTPRLITKKEIHGIMPSNYFSKFNPYLYPLLLQQLNKLFRYNEHRLKIAETYLKAGLVFSGKAKFKEGGIFLRYPLTSLRRDEIIARLKNEGIYIGDWYTSVLAPAKSNFEIYGYKIGSCKEAEKAALVSFNLPTHINISQEEAEILTEEIYSLMKE